MVARGCSVVTSVGLRGVDGVLVVESAPVRNDGVDAHRARGVSLFRPLCEGHRHGWFQALS